MPPDHVLTKSFYLLSDMPGRWTGGKVWIESGTGRVNDGVTTIIIGSNDYAGAWAVDQRGRGIMPVSPGGGGAHNWSPMSFNPQTGLVYIPSRGWEPSGVVVTENRPIRIRADGTYKFDSGTVALAV